MQQEFITAEEFAQRLKISRATVFDWKRRGILRQGRHYVRFGRVVRFIWSEELVARLLEDCLAGDPDQEDTGNTEKRKRTKGTNQINWDY